MLRSGRKIPRYGLAVVATALALVLRQLLTPLWGQTLPYLTFYPAVMLVSLFEGLGPGLLATALSSLSSLYFFTLPANQGILTISDAVALSIFTFINVLIVYLNEKFHRAMRLIKESEERLRHADQQKDEFLAMVGHELRNPLNNLASSVYLLRSHSHDEAIRQRSVEVIDRQVKQMSRIIGDLLDLSRLGQRKLHLTTERLDVSALVRETTEDFCRGLQKNLTIALETPPTPVWIEGDRTRVAQMLTNLLHNAMKFTDSQGKVDVRVLSKTVPNSVLISVRDNGAGIDPELLPRLFNVYTQGDRTLAPTEPGLGLGLAIVKSLAELHGGTVEAFSLGNGKGSEFRFTLPQADSSTVGRKAAQETTILATEKAIAASQPDRKR